MTEDYTQQRLGDDPTTETTPTAEAEDDELSFGKHLDVDVPGVGDATDTGESGSDDTLEERVLAAYYEAVDPHLIDAGWGFEPAKSVEFGYTDQSLLNHVRNGVAALARVNELIDEVGGVPRDEAELRAAVALYVIHDLHKLDAERDGDPRRRFDIPESEVESYVEQFGLLDWADELSLADFASCAVDHHDDWTANHETSTRRFNEHRPSVRLADALASSDRPEGAAEPKVEDAVAAAYPNAAGSFSLRHHRLDTVTGVLTNLLNAAVADTLGSQFHRLLLYQDGVVYLTPADAEPPTTGEAFLDEVFEQLRSNVRSSHEAYQDEGQLVDNLGVESQGFYSINDQDFFYAGPETVLEAVALKAATDADPDSDPTDAMTDTMADLESHLPFDITRTREPVGLARLAYTIKRSFIDPVLDTSGDSQSSLRATCGLFNVDEATTSGIETADEELPLRAGGKWDHAYGIGQSLLDRGLTEYSDLATLVIEGLDDLNPEWRTIVSKGQTGNLRTELSAFLVETVTLDGRRVGGSEDRLTDPFTEYGGSRRGKTCDLCNRGTTGTKGDMKSSKSLTTLQSGYSNHVAVDAGKPEKLLVCYPCQVELSLREAGAERREGGRLYYHLVPDYFYTPASWRDYATFADNFGPDAKTELGGLAEAVLHVGEGGIDPSSHPGRDAETVLSDYVGGLLNPEHGGSMVETLDRGFDHASGFGTQTFAYFKPTDNDTEFQFFGTFLGLALASYTGLRVVVSESPIPDIRGRDFQQTARIGAGFSQVHDFYGVEIPLSALRDRLNAAAALIRLGYGNEREDALFAKYLRATRNKPLPGSYLLKRIAQADDGDNAGFLLEEARILDEACGDPTTDTRHK
ncbi:type I-D CRISPR-associated protein Cas10d/Csc3 [Halorientalis sp.]|uniref:type I-D CRISPR-associated protein Cas10d/Csc3 n=1 Tax=Halorientalis sp. TaxID=1931229 RepID=UPI0026080CDE|nr:type I-D CRISPR-associated protein Cas10d/Csc3 [Halorientalis sp.]